MKKIACLTACLLLASAGTTVFAGGLQREEAVYHNKEGSAVLVIDEKAAFPVVASLEVVSLAEFQLATVSRNEPYLDNTNTVKRSEKVPAETKQYIPVADRPPAATGGKMTKVHYLFKGRSTMDL